MTAPSRAVIDLDAYVHNLRTVRRYVGNRAGLVAVVKANAYGHGLLPIARTAESQGVRMLGVATMEEGVALREGGIEAPILVMYQPHADALPLAIEHDLRVTVCDKAAAERLGALAERANRVAVIHAMLDTGMNRQGIALDEAAPVLHHFTRIAHLDIEGVCTHFPAADIVDDDYTHEQLMRFRRALRHLEREGIPYSVAHIANSAALINYPGSRFDMVRPGLMSYGIWPCAGAAEPGLLRPVLRWETQVTQVRELAAGESVSYGRTYTAEEPRRLAVLPVGYADGYRHAFSNRAEVLINGIRCRVRGAVCMDQVVVDITDAGPVQPGDTAVLLGADGTQTVSAAELAELAGTIPYEIVAGIGSRVARAYTSAATSSVARAS